MKRTSTNTSEIQNPIRSLDVEVLDVGVEDPDPVMDTDGVEKLVAGFGKGTVGNVRLCGKGASLKDLTGKGD